MGLERLVLLTGSAGTAAEKSPPADVYVVAVGDNAHRFALAAVEALRSSRPDLRIIQHTGGGSFKSQIKKADKSGARLALIVGEDEAAQGVVTLKPLRDQGEQQQRPLGELEAAVTTLL